MTKEEAGFAGPVTRERLMMTFLATSGLPTALIAAGAMGGACSALSVFVVLRRWAFVGEGIAHAGLGGAGMAWMLAVLFPGAALLRSAGGVYGAAVVFCLLMALAMGWMTRRERVRSDSAIGIVLVASLAWGFLGYALYRRATGIEPSGWSEMLWGQVTGMGMGEVLAAIGIAVGVLMVLVLLGREIVYYSFDPSLAEISGVRVGFIHYLLILLVALTIVLGMRLMGSVLVAALLVLPGSAALLVTRDFRRVMVIAVVVGLVGALAGPVVSAVWPFVPAGPAIVLVLVGEFAGVYLWQALSRRRGTV